MGLSILLWRGWQPAFRDGLTFSTVAEMGVGGTEMQMLWHASHLVALGHQVQILGAGPRTLEERGVEFIGTATRAAQETAISKGQVRPPDIVFLEGAYHAARFFRDTYPRARIVHVGQNIDVGADRAAFAQRDWVDAYAFVGEGHLADYSARYPRLRGKFVLVRNAIPWSEFHSRVVPRPVEEKVIWVGSWNKKGLRKWCEVMHDAMRERPSLRWSLCGPKYGTNSHPLPSHLTAGLTLPWERIAVSCLPLTELLEEISSARVIIVSLGNECGPGSVLDAHAMGRPVISGNDLVYAFSNPNGTGLRVTQREEATAALGHLLDRPDAGDAMGRAGRAFVLRNYHEDRQREDLRGLIDYLQLDDRSRLLSQVPGTSQGEQIRQDFCDKVGRKFRTWRIIRR
ncbi:MAG: glycosyltransferase family 4 protein [Planctomycetaceae bacterium]|nr:glycosyltransferase family 4 protein [Planctomycetaceae bacterium]